MPEDKARNRLESDLLDAMMCIEDLKQALELRMARDPREAEERRYLIRQNKKLLNQLYESAKKIERLELTKVEMKEQLELLDFQILEVENQKAMMEEELRKLPSCNHSETQTEDSEDSVSHLVQHLKEQLTELQSELCSQKAETAAALAKQHHLDNLVRELRRDNVDLRDQLSKLDDAENSLAESDKPLATGVRALQSQLDTQLERVRELESKLKASRDYSEELETRLQTMDLFKKSHGAADIQPTTDNTQVSQAAETPSTQALSQNTCMPVISQLVLQTFRPATCLVSLNGMGALDLQAAMHDAMTGSGHAAGLRVPRVDDLLLQETIRTFHALLAERDQEMVQLKRYIRANVDTDDSSSLVLPDLCEAAIQTDLYLGQAERLSQVADTLVTGGFVLTAEQVSALKEEINRCLAVMTQCKSEGSSKQPQPQIADVLSFGDLISAVVQMGQLAEDVRLQMTLSRSSEQQILTTDLRVTPIGESELCAVTSVDQTDKQPLLPATERLIGEEDHSSLDIISHIIRKLKGEDNQQCHVKIEQPPVQVGDEPKLSRVPIHEIRPVTLTVEERATSRDQETPPLFETKLCTNKEQSPTHGQSQPVGRHTVLEKSIFPITKTTAQSTGVLRRAEEPDHEHHSSPVTSPSDEEDEYEAGFQFHVGPMQNVAHLANKQARELIRDVDFIQQRYPPKHEDLTEDISEVISFCDWKPVSRKPLQVAQSNYQTGDDDSPSEAGTAHKLQPTTQPKSRTFDFASLFGFGATTTKKMDVVGADSRLTEFAGKISAHKPVQLPDIPDWTSFGTLSFELVCTIHQEAIIFVHLFESSCFSSHCSTGQQNKPQQNDCFGISATIHRLKMNADALAMQTLEELQRPLKKDSTDDKLLMTQSSAESFQAFLLNNIDYWLKYDPPTPKSGRRNTLLEKSAMAKQRWLETALLGLSLLRISSIPSTTLSTEECLIIPMISSETPAQLPDVRSSMGCRWKGKPYNTLSRSLLTNLVYSSKITTNWIISATDLFYLPSKHLTLIALRLFQDQNGANGPCENNRRGLPRMRTPLLKEILSERIRSSCQLLSGTLYQHVAHSEVLFSVLKELSPSDDSPASLNSRGTLGILAAQLRLCLRIKARLWECLTESLLSTCSHTVLDALTSALNPQVANSICRLAGNDKYLALNTLFRLLCAMHFEPACVIPSAANTSDTCCHSYLLPSSLQFKSALSLDSTIHTWPADRLWMTALFYKEFLLNLLFGCQQDRSSHLLRIQTALNVLSNYKNKRVTGGTVWIPRQRFNYSQDTESFVLLRVYHAAVLELLRIHPHPSEMKDRLSKSARILSLAPLNSANRITVRGLLRYLEEYRNKMCKLPCVVIQLAHLWCHTSQDLGIDDDLDHSLSNTDREHHFMGSILKPLEQLSTFRPPLCDRRLALVEPSVYFAVLPEAEKFNSFGALTERIIQRLQRQLSGSIPSRLLSTSRRRRQELERRVLEVTDDLARARAEARAAETSLSAARRTEAALRRRLLVAMDIQGSDADGSSNRHSLGPNAGLDTRENLELQTALIKSEATNASLTEAAQLDRTRLHDQTMRIGQLEAEHRALMDRLSILQANEASAQRGIVRLQALYEDMLREYSEARFQDLSWRTRDRSRSNFRNGTSNGVEKKTNGTGSHSTFTKLQQQIATLEEENLSLKLAIREAEEARGTVTSQPVGRCSAPACIEVRGLLKAFQDRFTDVMGQLTRTQQCLEAAQANSGQDLDTSMASTPNTGLTLVTTVQKRFNALQDLLDNDAATLSENEMDNVRVKMSDCLDALAHLHRWLQLYIRSTDAEIADLRSTILEMRIASMSSDQTLITTCANGTGEHPFSCSISLNKKLDMDLLHQREQELQQLRARVRDLEAEVELASPHYR
ncbi:hypothetical protein T265_00320 [Opisthorchis viverrini]|uniref:Uncharacterized protein n=1 Tax=Opisthorchis viverrini TaxID=6198 RepID=A0A075A3C6_OPIVI|nr:hypothetical protein T265_00320 [Opisthorchis viverrini]KER33876.1 hypothetical protein T265_00320 [Opisthorchis viverrini]